MSKDYRRCSRCVMDNSSDSTIIFDSNGFCNYCKDALEVGEKIYFPNENGQKKLENMIFRLKKINKKKDFDCIMGLSGGLDSSYLAYLGNKWGLRIMAIHVDDGYDTDISVNNINRLCNKANIELITVKPDEEQYNDLIRAFILAEVPNVAIPQDNILFAHLYKYARKTGIKQFLSGGNYALESILQKGNTYTAYDLANIKDINKKFGKKPINKLTFISEFQRDLDRHLLKIESIRPLNYINYNRKQAMQELLDFCDFEYYGSKHHENNLTKFIQTYWFVNKFGVDKRTSHLSSMIISGQMTRDEALKELEKPLYDEKEMDCLIDSILNKIQLSRNTFNEIMKRPGKQHNLYKTSKYEKVKDCRYRVNKKETQ
ncbi:N-acetyl sugar amidotransferase [Eubacterium limosum]|uniref:N-acetyl sugar amidotransferase n=1 Tax=Eubacterium limosum TaxID=1736 RepID=UPI00371CBCD2